MALASRKERTRSPLFSRGRVCRRGASPPGHIRPFQLPQNHQHHLLLQPNPSPNHADTAMAQTKSNRRHVKARTRLDGSPSRSLPAPTRAQILRQNSRRLRLRRFIRKPRTATTTKPRPVQPTRSTNQAKSRWKLQRRTLQSSLQMSTHQPSPRPPLTVPHSGQLRLCPSQYSESPVQMARDHLPDISLLFRPLQSLNLDSQ